ncbi:hypothetical protein OEIGOIKO_00563 [Streptomyces chrestomyceticus JCM 4735]|uniref:Uncharacterized protein n=1 Tax=Streptomyces chrestomyceticus JCM 4735 TaxID=1306181 RepID=A0A7U9PVZ7_9ACTN|nr:hypothetical protein OEIGOIKO_00563 [Streptomyces chrestomyceticus JCM 4735]
MTSLPRHAELAEHLCRSEVARVTSGIDAVEPKIREPSLKQLPPDRRSDASSPDPRMHGIRDLALTLPPAPDVELTYAEYVALDTRRIHEPLLR